MSFKLIICAMYAVVLSGTSVLGQACDNTYTGPLGGEWQEDTHWSLLHQPDDTEVACIPAGTIAVVYEGRCVGGPKNGDVCDNYQPGFCGSGYICDRDLLPVAEAKAINISPGGEVVVRYCGNLIIHEDSTVNGKLSIPIYQNWLRIASSLTITGAGGEITGDSYTFPHYLPPSISPNTTCAGGANEGKQCDFDEDCPSSTCDAPSTLPTLTFAAGDICDGGANDGLPCTITADCPSGTCSTNDNTDKTKSLWVHNGLSFYIPIVNNAWVEADYNYVYVNEPSSGSGYWAAGKDTSKLSPTRGELSILAAVSGSGTWLLDDASDAIIEFEAACTGLTGDFKIQKGTLVIAENVTTSGKLQFQTVSGSKPVISVAQGKIAIFDSD